MNKLLDSMLESISPATQSQAIDFLAAIDETIRSPNLLPGKIRAELPPLGATENEADPIALVKFFTPDGQLTWYAFEFDGDDTFFGFVKGDFDELGYFPLSELQAIRGKMGLPVARDLYFEATALSKLR